MGQMMIKKSRDERLVDLLDRQAVTSHPARKVRNARLIAADAMRRVAAFGQIVSESIEVGGQRSVAKPLVYVAGRFSDRIHTSIA